MKPKKKISKNVVMLAAAVTLLAALSTVAVATDLFGLRSWLMPEKLPVQQPDSQGRMEQVDAISLSGYQDMPEGKASAEWYSFLNGYDVTGAAVAADANPGGVDEKYALYQVYNQEMADKLEEIVEKYDLKLHTAFIDVYEHPEAMEGIWEALGENRAYSAYMYEDGTFQFDGEYDLPDYGTVDYQFRRAVRGTFNEVVLNVGDISQYKEWIYRTACGQTVTLALSPYKALVLADLGDSFVTVNVLAGTETDPEDIFSSGPISAEELEALADSFDFTVLTPVRTPDLTALGEAAIPDGAISPETVEDAIYGAAGIQEFVAQEFYAGFVRAIEEDRREDVAAQIAWPRTVTVPGGTFTVETAEDFLPYYDDIFTPALLDAIHKNQYTADRADLFTNGGMVGAAGGAIWFALVEDGKIAVITVQNIGGWSLCPGGSAGVQPDVAGTYTNTQGTETVYSRLELRSQGDGTYAVSMQIHRTAALDGTAAYQDGGLYFVCGDPAVEAKLVIDGDAAEAVITRSELSDIRPGDVFQFPDGKK